MGSSGCLAPLEVILSRHTGNIEPSLGSVTFSLSRTTRPGSVRRRAKSSEGKEFNLHQAPTTPVFRREEGSAMQVNLKPPFSHLQVWISSHPPPLSLSRDHLSPPIPGGLSTNTMRHQWDSSDLETYALYAAQRQDTKYLITIGRRNLTWDTSPILTI